MLKVTKFGGSSMADASQYKKVRDIILRDPSRKVVVVSAAGKAFSDDHKITDLLFLCYAHVKYGVSCDDVYNMIRTRYTEIRDELGLSLNLEDEFDKVKARLDKKEISQDELVSRGEYFSAKLMAAYLGYDFIDASEWVKFLFDGTVDKEATYKAFFALADGRNVVTPGFYGIMPDGCIRTFSRGGSDITGALAAAALNADVYENWTDVSGILMADPRIIDNPPAIPEITYEELRELSFSGAQVLHEASIFPVREKGIPLNIKNTNAPDEPGTMIKENFDSDQDPDRFLTGVAGKKDYSVITIKKKGMGGEVGALRKILTILEKHGISVDYVPNGIDNVALVINSSSLSSKLYSIMAEIQKDFEPDSINVHEGVAVIAAVGRRMAFKPGISGKLFAALGNAGINIRMISQGPDELNIIFGVDNQDFARAVQVIYNSFVK